MVCPTCRRFTPPGVSRCPACGTVYGGAKPADRAARQQPSAPRAPLPPSALPGARIAASAADRVNAAAALVNQVAVWLQGPAAPESAAPAACPAPTKHPQPLPVARASATSPASQPAATPRTPAAAPGPLVLPESTLLANGHYRLGPLLGRGSFGITYRAHDQRLDRAVAVKEFFPEGSYRLSGTIVPPASLGRDGYESERRHFIDEARVLARFHRPGIVAVYEVFEENDTAYMVMENVPGRTLVELLKERNAPLPVSDALRYVLAVADALAAVHEQHLLHRDVKPGNILITPENEAVLIDFGAARSFDRNQRTSVMTAIGTPGYAPLEQWGSSGRFGPTSDVYALAATLYHLVTGRMPPSAADRAADDTLVTPHLLNRSVSEPVSAAIVAALAVRMEERPQTMAAFAASLRNARNARARSRTAPPAAPPPAAPRVARSAAAQDAARPAAPTAVSAAPQAPAPVPAAAAPAAQPVAPVPKRRRFPWPRRRRETALWAGAAVFAPALFSLWLTAVLCTTPVLLACSVSPSWSLRRAARRCLRSTVEISLRCIGVCTVSVVSLGIMLALGAHYAARRLMSRTATVLRPTP